MVSNFDFLKKDFFQILEKWLRNIVTLIQIHV